MYVEPNDVGLFAKVVVGLLDHPELRAPMGAIGRERVVDELAWEHQQRAYLGVFDELVHSTAGSEG